MTEPSETLSISLQDPSIKMGFLLFDPRKKGRTEIKTDGRIIIKKTKDLSLSIQNPGISIGPIAFRCDSFVPVMKWESTFFLFDVLYPGILSGRLVKMSMDDDKSISHSRWNLHKTCPFVFLLSYKTDSISNLLKKMKIFLNWAILG